MPVVKAQQMSLDPNLEALLQPLESRLHQRERHNKPALREVPYPDSLRYYLTNVSQFSSLHLRFLQEVKFSKQEPKDPDDLF